MIKPGERDSPRGPGCGMSGCPDVWGSFRTFLDTARIKEFPLRKNSAGNHKNGPRRMRK